MLSDPKLRSQVDALWDKFWTGGLANPLDAIEQFSYLLFLKQLEDHANAAERQAKRRGIAYQPKLPREMRWSYWTQLKAVEALDHLKKQVFPNIVKLADEHSSFAQYMRNAECKISKPSLLIEACKLIDQMDISGQNQDVQGDLFEYMLNHLNISGRNGQFRTPRHIIRMMVQMTAPQPHERIGDLAAGTGGFLVNAYQYMLESHTSPEILEYDETGFPHHLIGDKLTKEEAQALQSPKALRGFDNDSGMIMLRIGSMNLMLHGLASPQFFYTDTLSKDFEHTKEYDLILMNPPFKGAVDKNDVNPTLPDNTTKSELLFLHLVLRALDMGGRAAVIVPDGVLFGSSRAHVETRKKIIEENRLDGVISMPSGVFKPYAGVSTAILFLTRGGRTERIWFYDMAHDGFSLDDKRTPVAENDIPDVVDCWKKREDKHFRESREQRIAELRKQLTPLKHERLALHEEIDEQTFVKVLTEDLPAPHPLLGYVQLRDREPFDPARFEAAQKELAELEARIQPPQAELDRLSRQFWVTKEQVKANKYDLSASRYRQADSEDFYHPDSNEVIWRLEDLYQVINHDLNDLMAKIDPGSWGEGYSDEAGVEPDSDAPS